MGRLGGIRGRDVMRVAEDLGWREARRKGDHRIYRSRDQRSNLSIPDHREMAEGTLRSLIAKMGLTVDDFVAMVKK